MDNCSTVTIQVSEPSCSLIVLNIEMHDKNQLSIQSTAMLILLTQIPKTHYIGVILEEP